MKLVIGGYAQGKLNYVLQTYQLQMNQVWDGMILENFSGNEIIFNHFHNWMKEEIRRGTNPEEQILELVKQYPDVIIVSDEIGNGIVPMDAFEREYRERTGRVLIELAKQAESVERVICGIAQKIK